MRNRIKKLRKIIKEEIRKYLIKSKDEKERMVKKLKSLQDEFGDEEALAAFFVEFYKGRLNKAVSQAERILRRDKSDKKKGNVIDKKV